MWSRGEGNIAAANAGVFRSRPGADGFRAHIGRTLKVDRRDGGVYGGRGEVLRHSQCKERAHCREAGTDDPYVYLDSRESGLIGIVECAVVGVCEVVQTV